MKARKVTAGTSRLLCRFGGVCLMGLIVVAVGDVAAREATGAGIPSAIQISEVLLVAMAFFALADTYRTGGHVSFDLLTDRLNSRAASAVCAIGRATVLAVLILICVKSAHIAIDSYQTGEVKLGELGIPVWPVRAVIPLGLFALAAEVAFGLVDDAHSVLGGGAGDSEESRGTDEALPMAPPTV